MCQLTPNVLHECVKVENCVELIVQNVRLVHPVLVCPGVPELQGNSIFSPQTAVWQLSEEIWQIFGQIVKKNCLAHTHTHTHTDGMKDVELS